MPNYRAECNRSQQSPRHAPRDPSDKSVCSRNNGYQDVRLFVLFVTFRGPLGVWSVALSARWRFHLRTGDRLEDNCFTTTIVTRLSYAGPCGYDKQWVVYWHCTFHDLPRQSIIWTLTPSRCRKIDTFSRLYKRACVWVNVCASAIAIKKKSNGQWIPETMFRFTRWCAILTGGFLELQPKAFDNSHSACRPSDITGCAIALTHRPTACERSSAAQSRKVVYKIVLLEKKWFWQWITKSTLYVGDCLFE